MGKRRIISTALFLFTFVVIFSTNALAFTININPGGYSGQYHIPGVTSFLTGPTSVSLGPGTYGMAVGNGVFGFSIDGSVLVSQSSGAAVGGNGTLTFNTVMIRVDPDEYTGNYHVPGVNFSFLTGVQNAIYGARHNGKQTECGRHGRKFRYRLERGSKSVQSGSGDYRTDVHNLPVQVCESAARAGDHHWRSDRR